MPTARDLLLQDGDLFVGGQDLALVYDAAAIAQQCQITLQTFAGEVFFNTAAGSRWFDILGNKTASDADFANETRRALLTVPGVSTVQNILVLRDSVRIGTISAEVTTNTGALLSVQATV